MYPSFKIRLLNVEHSIITVPHKKGVTMKNMFQIWILLVVFQVSLSVKIQDIRTLLDSNSNTNTQDTWKLLKAMTAAIGNLEEKVLELEPLKQRVKELETKLELKAFEMTKLDAMFKQYLKTKPSRDCPDQTHALTLQITKPSKDKIPKNKGIRQTESVAFTAVLNQNLVHLGKNQVIKFNGVWLNEGSGYNAQTGIFTAPRSGNYLFIYNFGHHGTGETWLELVLNGHGINAAAIEGKFVDHNLQGGNGAVLRLRQGDLVWVQTTVLSDVSVEGYTSSFSGALLN